MHRPLGRRTKWHVRAALDICFGRPGKGPAQTVETYRFGDQMYDRQRLQLLPQACAISRAKYDRNISSCPNQAGDIQAISAMGQPVIQNDNIGLQLKDGLNRFLLGRDGSANLVTQIPSHVDQHPSDHGLVLDKQ
jgi:hypothetical protein